MWLFDCFKEPKKQEYEYVCPKHGKQNMILHFQYAVDKRFCFECIAEKLTELGVNELVKKEVA